MRGRGHEWCKDKTSHHYVPLWDCRSSTLSMAYVSGGMWFQHEDNSLYVPKCGWYYVSSQIAHQSISVHAKNYSHSLKIDRNCNDSDNIYTHTTFSMIGQLENGSHAKTTTFVGDIVKICTGGRIYVHLPTFYNSCCPRGDSELTSITAHLVREASCEWPVASFDTPQEPFQERNRRSEIPQT